MASGTAGVAEDTVRVLEELLGTFADQLSKDDIKEKERRRGGSKEATWRTA